MKNKLLAYFLLLFPIMLSGNGMITVHAWTDGSGNPAFKTIKDVSIISEHLDVTLNKVTSDIKVTYLLWNNSDVTYANEYYGFPVDYYVGKDNNSDLLEWNDSYISNISFKVNDVVAESHTSSDTLMVQGDKKQSDSRDLHRRWFYTQISIQSHSLTKLEVYYTIENHTSIDGDSPMYLSMLEQPMQNVFSYDFSPAKHWHDGIIRDFSIRVDASNLTTTERQEVRFSPNHEGEILYEFDSNEGQIYTFEARNFDLNKAPRLNISYFVTNINDAYDNLIDLYMPHDKYVLTASNSLPNYPISNLQDMNLETAWAVKSGVGEWLEYDFSKNPNRGLRLSGFTLVNGYTKSEKAYSENNIIKRVAIEVVPTKGEPIEIVTELDRMPYQEIYFKSIFDGYYKKSITFTHDFFEHLDFLDWDIAIKKLRLKVLEVDKGSKYDELCISEIILLN